MHRYTAGGREHPRVHKHVLLVFEDEETLAALDSLQLHDYLRVSVARNGLSGVEKFCRAIVRDEAFHAVVAQYDMRVLSGMDVLRRIRSIAPDTRTMLFVRAGCYSNQIEKVALADDIVTEPVRIAELLVGSMS